MALAITYLLFVFICYLMDNNTNQKYNLIQRDRKLYLTFHFLFIIFFTLVFALRAESVGSDTQRYVVGFKTSPYRTYESIFNADGEKKEYLYLVLTKIIATYTDSIIVFFGVYGALFTFSYGNMVHKHSDNYFVSYIMLVAMYFSFIISGMRQLAAMSILLMSYGFIVRKKLVPFLLCVAVAYYFHNSAIIFLLAYPVAHMKWGKGQFVILAVCIIMAYLMPGVATKVVFEWLAWDRFETYEAHSATLTSSGFIIKIAILAFNLFHYKGTVEKNSENLKFYNLSIFGTSLQAFTVVMSQAFRMSMYFSIFDTILTANVLAALRTDTNFKAKNKAFVYIGVISLLIVYYLFISTPVDYKMSISFWE